MSDRLPKYIEPLSLVKRGGRLSGCIPLKGMARLAESVVALKGDASVDLVFGRNELGKPVMQGQISATMVMRCERCLGDFDVPVTANVQVGLLKTRDQAVDLPDELEPLLVESDEPMLLADLVEDELILSLPIAPRHATKDGCINLDEYKAEDEPQEEKQNPFAILAALKEKH